MQTWKQELEVGATIKTTEGRWVRIIAVNAKTITARYVLAYSNEPSEVSIKISDLLMHTLHKSSLK